MHTSGANWWYDPKLAPKHRSTTKFLVICRLFWTIWPMNEYVTTIDDEIVSISDDTRTVIEAVGIVGDLVK